MLSRVADSIYWMSRYVERAENTARFMDVNMNLMLDLADLPAEHQWLPLVRTTGDVESFFEKYETPTRENVIHFLAIDPDYENSILSCLRKARENARTIREAISSEMWEQVNRFYQLLLRASKSGQAMDDPDYFFQSVKQESHLLAGVTDATLTHGESWHFARVGRLLERADKTSRILDVKYFILLPKMEYIGGPLDNIQWGAVLKSASAFEMYRKQYHHITPGEVTEFLVLDRNFPRAIHYCLVKAEESLHDITGAPHGSFRTVAEQRLGRLRSKFDYTSIEEIIHGGMHEFLDGFQGQLNEVGEAIFNTFFTLRPVVAQQQSAQ